MGSHEIFSPVCESGDMKRTITGHTSHVAFIDNQHVQLLTHAAAAAKRRMCPKLNFEKEREQSSTRGSIYKGTQVAAIV